MKALPDGLVAYKKTPVFTEATIPPGLTKEHCTKAGVWGVIHVLSGRLRYQVPAAGIDLELSPDRSGLIEPEARHSVAVAAGPLRFTIEFYR